MKRTEQQNRAIHLWIERVEDELRKQITKIGPELVEALEKDGESKKYTVKAISDETN